MYAKIFHKILGSSIAEDRRLRHFFMDMLLLANADGHIVMTNAHIKRMINCSQEELDWGLQELQKPDPQSSSQEHEGRRIEPLAGHGHGWTILNWPLYNPIQSAAGLRKTSTDRVKKHRAVKRGETFHETPGNSETNETMFHSIDVDETVALHKHVNPAVAATVAELVESGFEEQVVVLDDDAPPF